MRAVDANLLVRLVIQDEPKQAAAAEAFISKRAWVSHLVLAEFVWVLDAVYQLKASQIADAVDMLTEHEHLTIQEADVVQDALREFRGHLSEGFTDCLILAMARKEGHLPLGTFDRRLSKLDGVELL
ncbi:MAG: type II toxin-antitoxin system VapC family toxin [Planctomycetes bacterium]|nr:type II toxin-antitoxin system VapC family toxin [Planctomycetota bacterium]